MGQSSQRRRKCFLQHPYCCFCGGQTPATTIDHQPGRLFFKAREWPENFEFPACQRCNEVSRFSEKALGILLHGESESQERGAYLQNARSFHAENPGQIEDMVFRSANEVRRLFRDRGVEKADDVAFGEIPVIRLNAEFWEPHFEMFARKLLLAIHYQCFGRPIPRSGGVIASTFTNFNVLENGLPEGLLEPAEKFAFPVRNGKSLADQFAVRYNVVTGHDAGLFILKFHDRLLISGITTSDVSWLSQGQHMQPPFEWSGQ